LFGYRARVGQNLRVTSKYLKAGEQRAELVEALFAKIARRYDLVNDVMTAGMHRAWKRQLVKRSGFSSGKRALDLCCGTGDIAFLLAARAMNNMEERDIVEIGEKKTPEGARAAARLRVPPASIIGLDFTEPMLRLAEARTRLLQKHGHEAGLAFVRGDALRLPFPDETFDVVTVGYGLRNLADLRAGLEEIRRVLKRGGIFLSLDMGKPANRLWRTILFTHLRLTLPALGWLFLRDADAYRYLVDSLEIYPAQEGVKRAMEEIGFVELGVKNFCGGAMGLNFGKK
jgi:demethylmenaquinone methyltransferase/2-methoxy-6-polyprenyl-1,4-benzoquinol methylase